MGLSPEIVADPGCELGESPLWHPGQNKLYWIDIPTGRLFCYDPDQDRYEEVFKTEIIGGLTIQHDEGLLLLLTDGFVGTFRDGRFSKSKMLHDGQRGFRFNDAIADPAGRVYTGTMAYTRKPHTIAGRISRKLRRGLGVPRSSKKRVGNLYRFDPNGNVSIVVHGVGRPNGMGFSPDRKTFYTTDTVAREIYAFDYDEETGAITNQRVAIRFSADGGQPDGLTVDAEGCVWSALIDSGCVTRFTSTGREIDRIQFPTNKLTSVMFGGVDKRDLYVTSAGGNRRDVYGHAAGAVFRIRVSTPGVSEYFSRIP